MPDEFKGRRGRKVPPDRFLADRPSPQRRPQKSLSLLHLTTRPLHLNAPCPTSRFMSDTLHIIGGGMAGSEAAWQAANAGINVVIHEMRPEVGTFAHQTGLLGEMVCSNSFRSDDNEQNAVGLLHWEMRQADGLIMATADKHRLPAGGALAVDRDPFAQSVTDALMGTQMSASSMARSLNCLPKGIGLLPLVR